MRANHLDAENSTLSDDPSAAFPPWSARVRFADRDVAWLLGGDEEIAA
jgi:hypothetical protein